MSGAAVLGSTFAVGSDFEHAGLRHQPTARAVGRQRHLSHRDTCDPGNPVEQVRTDVGELGIGDQTGDSAFTGKPVSYSPTDILDTDPLLDFLGNNGGPTLTHALLSGSPAINAGNNDGAPITDQRGYARIVSGIIDIGAYEYYPIE